MRTAILAVIAAAALSGAAQAQAPEAAAPAAAPAVAPAPAADPAAAPAAAPVVATTPPAEPPPPPPALPTTGDGAAILAVLDQICTPAVRGGSIDALAKAQGYKLNKRDQVWVKPIGAEKAYTISLYPQGSNKDVCQAEIHFAIGQDAPIVSAVNIWSFLHQPQLVLQANYVATDADGVKRTRKSWEHFESSSAVAVNFTLERKADDTPLSSKYDVGKLFYQERKF